jgi:drug/metabolite transporter (DMT)-like permease
VKNKKVALIALFFSPLAWSTLYLFIKLCDNVNAINIAFIRFLFAGIILCPFYFLYRSKNKIKFFSYDFFILFILIILNGVFSSLFLILCTKYSTASIGSILINSNPIFIAILAPFLIKEKNKMINYIGIIVAFTGVIFIVSEGGNFSNLLHSNSFFGYIFGILGALSVAFSIVYLKKYFQKYNTWTITFYIFLISAIIIGVINLLFNDYQQLFSLPAINWLWLFLIGTISTAFAFSAFNYGVSVIGATKASVFKLFIPVFTVILAIIFLHENMTWYIIIGGIMTIFGLYLVQKNN